MTKTLTILLSLLATALAQSSTGVQQALTATTQIANSINTGLPQTATTGPQGFPIPYVPFVRLVMSSDSDNIVVLYLF